MSVFLAVTLGAMTIYSTFGFFLISTGAKAGQESILWVMRMAVLVFSVVLATEFWLLSGGLSRSDKCTLAIFVACQLVAVLGDVAAEVRRKKDGR